MNYGNFTPSLAHDINGVIIIYSVNNKKNFDDLGKWFDLLELEAPEDSY